MRTVFAVDVGRTSCRTSLWIDDEQVALAATDGEGSIGLTAPDGALIVDTLVRSAVLPLLHKSGLSGIDAVGIGVPGGLAVPDAARKLAERVLTSLPARSAAVTSDAITSHAGALAGEPGVVLAAGTGSVAIALGRGGRFHQIDGLGPWLGDEGSGAWIGLQGLRAAARAHHGRGPATVLLALALKQFGPLEQLAVRLSTGQNPARMAAGFAPAVALAAEQSDPIALKIMDEAALSLSASVMAGARAMDETDPVLATIVGGLLNMGSILLDPLNQELSRSDVPLQVIASRGTSLDGARSIAMSADGVHEPWIARTGEKPDFLSPRINR